MIPALLLALLVAAPAAAEVETAEPTRTVLHCGELVDAERASLAGETTLVIEGKNLVQVAPGAPAPGSGDRLVDLRSHTCMPGLMDMHVHLTGEYSQRSDIERFRLDPVDRAYRSVAYARRTLMAGFTTVRDLGAGANVNVALRDAILQGRVVGPRIFTSGGSIATTGGHADPTNGWRADLMGDPGPKRGVINGPMEARKAVRQRYKDGADLIKITATGGVLSTAASGQNAQFQDDELVALVETARDYDFHVAAHAHGAEGIKRAVRAGVASIEHGTLMDDEGMRLMKKHGTWYVPTILAGEWVAEKAREPGFFPPLVRPKAAAIGPQIQKTFGRAYAAGVPIAFGTDSGVSAHGDNGREFALMVEAGMPMLEAIRSATWSSALLLGQEDRIGSLAPGKRADVVAVPGDPREDASLMERVSFVMQAGVIHRVPDGAAPR